MKPHSPAELQTASDYLEFIIHMAEADMDALKHWHEATFKRNVYFDSILIRLRSLIEFLTAHSTSFDTDVIARHYVPEFQLPEARRSLAPRPEETNRHHARAPYNLADAQVDL